MINFIYGRSASQKSRVLTNMIAQSTEKVKPDKPLSLSGAFYTTKLKYSVISSAVSFIPFLTHHLTVSINVAVM